MLNFFKKLFSPITATLSFIQNYFKALIFIIILLILFSPGGTQSVQAPNLASVHLTGPIMDANKIVKTLDKLGDDKKIKGVLLVVNSPGGAVAPSVEIALAVKRLKEKKPVVAYAAGTMASGSYYASIWANRIVANPAATIGSIGVIMEGMNLHGLLDKVGVQPQVVKAGAYKEAGTPFREWTEQERKAIETHVFDIYQMFVNDVAKARHLDPNDHKKFADAQIFIAYKAKEVGLIDEIGSIKEAKTLLKELSGVQEARWKEKSRWEQYIESFAQESTKTLVNQLKGWVIY